MLAIVAISLALSSPSVMLSATCNAGDRLDKPTISQSSSQEFISYKNQVEDIL
jgi:hypothetical protein